MNDRRIAEAPPWRAQIITLFPEAFPGTLGISLIGRALLEKKWALDLINLREFGLGKHKNVDDTPAGGGAGMVLRADVLGGAIEEARRRTPGLPLLALSPRGVPFNQRMAERLSQGSGLCLICGRFEGLDQRIMEHYSIQEVSLGDFVLTGGEVAAQALIDASLRLIPSVIGNRVSLEEESFSDGLLEYPQYTRPARWNGISIPEVLLSGNHAEISRWRREQAERLTQERRPDLWRARLSADPNGEQERSGPK